MKRYYVSVTETLNKVVSVDAESKKDALEQVQKPTTIPLLFSTPTISAERP